MTMVTQPSSALCQRRAITTIVVGPSIRCNRRLLCARSRVDGQNLLNHKKAATTKVPVASKEITLWGALFQAGEEAANQV